MQSIKEKLYITLKNTFTEYDIDILEVSDFTSEKMQKTMDFLEDADKKQWFREKIENEDGLYIYIIKDKKIIATRFFNSYKNIFTDVYSKLLNILNTKLVFKISIGLSKLFDIFTKR